jgi:hypothetical protein
MARLFQGVLTSSFVVGMMHYPRAPATPVLGRILELRFGFGFGVGGFFDSGFLRLSVIGFLGMFFDSPLLNMLLHALRVFPCCTVLVKTYINTYF